MKTVEIKLSLHQKIEALSSRELTEVYGLFQNYLNSNDDTEEWNKLPHQLQDKITKGLAQAYGNNIKSLSEVTKRLRTKYVTNG